jgi:hypothetical protein
MILVMEEMQTMTKRDVQEEQLHKFNVDSNAKLKDAINPMALKAP